jgi:hypothetical protein
MYKTAMAHLQTHQSALEDCHINTTQPSTFNSRSQHHNNMEYNSHHLLLPSSVVLCYMDASISPDGSSPQLRQAGIGIKFVNMQVQPPNAIYIKVIVKEVSSVVMAEAVALALAASTATNLGFMQVSFLTDSSQLYHFLSGSEQTHPPDWRMKIYTDQFHYSAAQI